MLSRFANKTFALWVIIAGILGFVFPDVFKPIGSWIAILLGVMMFGMGLTLTTADFREIFRRPKDVFVGILAQFLIMPLAAFALCKAFALPPDLAVGLMLLGCVPGYGFELGHVPGSRRCRAFGHDHFVHDTACAARYAGPDVLLRQPVDRHQSDGNVPFDRTGDSAPDRCRRCRS